MASRVFTIHDYPESADEFFRREIREEIKKTLSDDHPFWNGVQWFLDWAREHLNSFLRNQFVQLPIVGRWASRIASTVTEFAFTVITTLVHYLRLVFSGSSIWMKAHAAAMNSWDVNESKGLLAQTYAYGKKMAAYFLEIVKQCLERAIQAKGLELSQEEKSEISDILDGLFASSEAAAFLAS